MAHGRRSRWDDFNWAPAQPAPRPRPDLHFTEPERESRLTSFAAVAWCVSRGHSVARVDNDAGRPVYVFNQHSPDAPENLSKAMSDYSAFRDQLREAAREAGCTS